MAEVIKDWCKTKSKETKSKKKEKKERGAAAVGRRRKKVRKMSGFLSFLS